MPLSQQQSNIIGGALAAVLIGGALVGGYSFFSTQSTQTHVVVDFPDGSVTDGMQCMWFTGLLQMPDGGAAKYGYAHACSILPDGGRDAPLPDNLLAFSAPDSIEAYDGGPRLEVWSEDDSNVPFPCACSTGTGCEQLVPDVAAGTSTWGPAYFGITLQPGYWRGAGCLRKACVELAGRSSWPSACPLQTP